MTRGKLCKFLEMDYVHGMGIIRCRRVFINGWGDKIKDRHITERECKNCRYYEPTSTPAIKNDDERSSGGAGCQRNLL